MKLYINLLIIFSITFTKVFADYDLETDIISRNSSRPGKILNIFSVVRFPNKVCAGDSYNGTCYSSSECSTRGGSTSGTCAGGYGVCCIFALGCGETTSENCSYMINPGTITAGECRLRVCPCSEHICQIRLDFSAFVLNQPDTSTTTIGKVGGVTVAEKSQCQTDIFSVTSPGNNAPPQICGTNTGEHMYMDSSEMCNELAFNIGTTTTVTRSWTIKITQYDCNFNNLAPDGCTQYFWGSTTDLVKTFNFSGGQHLASQDQNICVRRERGYCRICWTVTASGDFETSGATTAGTGAALFPTAATFGCCNIGTKLSKITKGYDCAIIPSPSKTGGTTLVAGQDGFCGGQLGTAAGTTAKTICSYKVPFNIRFISDLYETVSGTNEAGKTPNGFRLAYILKSC